MSTTLFVPLLFCLAAAGLGWHILGGPSWMWGLGGWVLSAPLTLMWAAFRTADAQDDGAVVEQRRRRA